MTYFFSELFPFNWLIMYHILDSIALSNLFSTGLVEIYWTVNIQRGFIETIFFHKTALSTYKWPMGQLGTGLIMTYFWQVDSQHVLRQKISPLNMLYDTSIKNDVLMYKCTIFIYTIYTHYSCTLLMFTNHVRICCTIYMYNFHVHYCSITNVLIRIFPGLDPSVG